MSAEPSAASSRSTYGAGYWGWTGEGSGMHAVGVAPRTNRRRVITALLVRFCRLHAPGFVSPC
jgi:hypothetical protein